MRHRRATKRIGVNSEHSKANLRNLAVSLINSETIKTTVSRAKLLRPFVERLVTFGKKGDLNSRRIVVARLNNKDAAKKLFDDIAKRFENRGGGYTRIIKAGFRNGDAAPVAYISFVEKEFSVKSKTKDSSKKEIDTIKDKVSEEISNKPTLTAEQAQESKSE